MTADIAIATGEPKVAELTWRNWACLGAFAFNAVLTLLSTAGFLGPDNTELSEKYTLLITPAGFAFAIWGPIFLWEGVFAGAQLLPSFRSSRVVELVTPGWVLACVSQGVWSVVFAQEWLTFACVAMCGILAGLLFIAWNTDGFAMTWAEYFCLRGCFSLHGGWIIAASALNVSVVADGAKSPPEVMLGLAVASVGVICVFATIFALTKKSADPIVCCVAAWAFNAISAKLSDPVDLDNPDRHNPFMWDRKTLGGLELAATYITFLALGLAAVAAGRAALATCGRADSEGGKRASADRVQMVQQV